MQGRKARKGLLMRKAGKDCWHARQERTADAPDAQDREGLLKRRAEGTLSGSAWQGRVLVAWAGRVQRGVPSSAWDELSCVGAENFQETI